MWLALVQTARRVLKSEFVVDNLHVIVDFVSHSSVNHSIICTLADVHTAGFLLSYRKNSNIIHANITKNGGLVAGMHIICVE